MDVMQLGSDMGLTKETLVKFALYIKDRGFDNDPSYMEEWAARFRSGRALIASDNDGQRRLREYKKRFGI